jgi:hypothetical protein
MHSDRKFLFDYFPRSYAPLNLENSQYLLLKFVSTTSETMEQNFMELGNYYGHKM